MTDCPTFGLWLEFEHWTPEPGDDPSVDFFNMVVTLPDGRRYALNVWTFEFLNRERHSGPGRHSPENSKEYLLPPDLFVERLDRSLIEREIAELLASDRMKPEWLSPSGETGT